MAKKNSNFYFKDARPVIEAYRQAAALFPKIKPSGYSAKKGQGNTPARILTAMWSDQHYGTDLTAEDHLLAYSNREECRATAKIVSNILEYKKDKRANTQLHLDFLGDDFAGMLGHDDKSLPELQIQSIRAAHIEAQVVAHCAANYPSVVVTRTWGNHGRDTLRHKGRADNFKWLNHEFTMWQQVRALCRGLGNVQWKTDKRPVGYSKLFGWQKLRTHGDTILGGKPGTTTFAAQLANISSSPYYNGPVHIAVLGHWHSGLQFTANHTEVFVNPALIPPDGYSESNGYLTAAGQFMFETTEKYAVGDVRKVRIDPKDYQDGGLDGLIQPWSEDLVFEEHDE